MTRRLRTLMLAASPRQPWITAKNLLLWHRVRKDPEAVAIWNKYFDARQYLAENRDVAKGNVDPLVHFLLRGNEEGRNPSRGFDTRYYLGRYPDVAASGINALLHFAGFGHREGRTLNDPFVELAAQPAIANPASINNSWRADYPLVTVVIPCFNYGHLVEQAIRSVLNQTYPDLEIIVVEGGSTDPASIAEVRRLEALGLSRTRFLFRDERHLAGDNRNFGIGFARGRYICCLDADDLLRPVYIEVAVFLAEVFGYDLVTPSVQCFGGSDPAWLVPDPSFPAILEENQVATAALFRRSVWAHVGGFRDWGVGAEHIPEDWDFWIRFLGHGFSGKSIREPLLLYRVHENSLTRQSTLELHRQRDVLRKANADLCAGIANHAQPLRPVVNQWANLSSVDDTPGILFATPFLTIGGAEKLLRTLAQRVIARGLRLIVITSRSLPDSVPDDSRSFERITPHVYPLSGLFSSDQVSGEFLRYLIRRYSVQTLMLAGCEFVYHLLPALKKEFPNLTVVDQLFNGDAHVYNNRHYSGSIDATIVPSDALSDSLVHGHGADPATIHVIPHGIPLPAETGETPPALPAAARGRILIGFFGRLSREKAADVFVEIVRALAKEPDLFFIMTGEGPERDCIRDQIRKYGLEDRIYAPGFVENVEPLMRAADIVVLPSRIDGMPLALLEAGALGKPVVASRVGSIPTIVQDHEFLCEAGDVSAFCRSILRLARDPELRQRMGAAARSRVDARYSSDRMLEAYERLLWPAGEVQACKKAAT